MGKLRVAAVEFGTLTIDLTCELPLSVAVG